MTATAAVPIDDMPAEALRVLASAFSWLADDVGPQLGVVLHGWADDLERRRPALDVAALLALAAADIAELHRVLWGVRFANQTVRLVVAAAAAPDTRLDVVAIAVAVRDALAQLGELRIAAFERASNRNSVEE